MDRTASNPGISLPPISGPRMANRTPPQFFSNTYDRLPPIHMPADMAAAHVFGGDPHYAYTDETSEAKRRRIARACDMCRKKKIKCDGRMPSCTHCTNYKTRCVFTHVEKKRSPPKGAKYIEGLENRLARMESLLRLSGLLGDEDGDTDLGTLEKKLAEKQREREARLASQTVSSPASPSQHTAATTANESMFTPRSSVQSPEPGVDGGHVAGGHAPSGPASQPTSSGGHDRKTTLPTSVHADRKVGKVGKDGKGGKDGKEEEAEALSEMMCSLVTNNYGETRYIGSSSGFSIFSPKGMQWVNEKTGDNSFQRMISSVSLDDNKWTNWKPEIFADLFSRPIFRPLPPKQEALSLLTDFFENFNCMFPLFHQPTFMHLVERQYSKDPYQGSGWWASLNVALSIAHRLRVMSNLVPQEDDEKAWAYLKNAMAVFSELTMRNTDLLSVQALLGMALFMQGTPNPQPTFLLVAAAIRLSHSIGLHKKGTGFNLNPIEIEQRKRVFWIAYMLDKDLCLRCGRPPAQDDDDMNVELPDADPADNIGNIPLADGKGKMNLFRVMCEFATIESRVYKRLYATKATKQTVGELLQTIGELDQELEAWKDSMPIDFRPEHEIKASHTPLILHVVMLHFTYYNCLTTIHRMCVHHGYWTSRLSNYAIQGLNAKPLNPRVYSSAALCVSSARASISLLKYIPQGDFSCVWLILYFPVSALVTLFGNTLQNPLDPRARSDTRLMNLVVTFLSMLGQEAESGGVHRMLGVCSEFERIAKVVIDKAEKEHANRRKRKNLDAHEPRPAHAAVASSPSPGPMSRSHSLSTQTQTQPTPRPTSSADEDCDAAASYQNTPTATPAEAAAAAHTAAEIVNGHNGRAAGQMQHQQRRSGGHNAVAGLLNKSSPAVPPSGSNSRTPSPGLLSGGWGPIAATPNYTTASATAATATVSASASASATARAPPPPLLLAPLQADPDLAFTSFADLTGFGSIPSEMPPQLPLSTSLRPPSLKEGNGDGLGDGTHLSGSMAATTAAAAAAAEAAQMPSAAFGADGDFLGGFQPLLPQDLFSLPMTLDWDWAEMSGGAYPTVENGNFDQF